MKKHHKKAMHHHLHAQEHAHRHHASHAEGLGVSEREHAPWGHGEYANMPQEVIKEEYSKVHPRSGVLDDTITGIDKSNMHSEHQRSKYLSSQH